MITFSKMKQDQKMQYVNEATARYCKNLVTTKNIDYDQGVKETEETFNTLFQEAYQNYIFNIVLNKSDQVIGNLWFGYHPSFKMGYITDLNFFEKYPIKDYFDDVIRFIEGIMKEQSIKNVSTYLFKDQKTLVKIFKKYGYDTTSTEKSGSTYYKVL